MNNSISLCLFLVCFLSLASCAENSQYKESQSRRFETKDTLAKVGEEQLAKAAAEPSSNLEKKTPQPPGPSASPETTDISIRTPELSDEEIAAIQLFVSSETGPVGGDGFQFRVIGIARDYSTRVIPSGEVTWSLDKKYEGYGELTAEGHLKAFVKGVFEVSASFGDLAATSKVEATKAQLVSIHFGCKPEELPMLAACKERDLTACNAGMENFDLAKGVTLQLGSNEQERLLLNTFPVFVTGYRSDCTLIDLSGRDQVSVVSEFDGMTIVQDGSIYGLDHAVRVASVGSAEQMKLTAYARTEAGAVLKGETVVNYRIENSQGGD